MKPLLVFVYMNGCGACEDSKPEFQKFAQKYGDRFQYGMIDVDKGNVPFPVPYTPSVALKMPKGIYYTDAAKLNGVTLESIEGWCRNALQDYKKRNG